MLHVTAIVYNIIREVYNEATQSYDFLLIKLLNSAIIYYAHIMHGYKRVMKVEVLSFYSKQADNIQLHFT